MPSTRTTSSAASPRTTPPSWPDGQGRSWSTTPNARSHASHAELRLFGSELQIVDRGSTNGTYVWSDTNADWVRLVPNQVASVKPGGWVAVGSRSFVFEAEGAG